MIRGRLARRYAAPLIVFTLLLALLALRKHSEQASRQPAAAEAESLSFFASLPNNLTVILLWTKYYSIEWNEPSFERNSICPGKCFITSDRRYTKVAAAVVFHASGMNLDPEDVPAYRSPSQYYVFFTQESPPMTAFKTRRGVWQSFPPNFFNLTMTYRSDSDIHVPYDRFIPTDEDVPGVSKYVYSWNDVEDAIAKKTKTAIQFVGNCYSGSGRETIVRALQRYIELDRFGYCAGRKCDKQCEEDILPSYRFYIAFENNVCDEYVTEKFWRVKKLIVPIVLKASVMRGIAPNNSFIAVDQFKSVASLAAYLMRLSRNDTEYAKYFEWTKHYQRTSTQLDEGRMRDGGGGDDDGSDPVCVERVDEIFRVEEHAEEGSEATMTVVDLTGEAVGGGRSDC
ncbi:Fucosyl transferase family protein [Aphelenchoides avenae]|nr:Fucosyl transferase family protein [Aphelenchus avenae]